MKTFTLSFLILSLSLPALAADEDCFSSGGSPSTHDMVRYDGSLIGEMDPYVVGDAGVIVLTNPFNTKQYVILEADESAPETEMLEKHLTVNQIIAVKKSCLEEIEDQETIDVLDDVRKSILAGSPRKIIANPTFVKLK